MAIDAAYATLPRYVQQIPKSKRDQDPVIEEQLVATSLWIDAKLFPLFFYLEETPSTRIYRAGDPTAPIASLDGLVVKAGSGRPVDWASITAMTIDEDFELFPRGALDGPRPRPFTDISLLSWGMTPVSEWQPKTYMPDDFLWQVTGIHGWPGGVPETIINACVIFTSMLRGEGPWSTNAFQTMDQVESASPQARAFLKELIGIYHPTGIVIG